MRLLRVVIAVAALLGIAPGANNAARAVDAINVRVDASAIDLTDAGATRSALARCTDVTHVFHCANDVRPETRLVIIEKLPFANPDVLNSMLGVGRSSFAFATARQVSARHAEGLA